MSAGRLVVIGNSGGGKSTLARRLVRARALPLVEVDALLWRPGWQLASDRDYDAAHARALAAEAWIMEGLGRLASIPARLDRATEIVLIDLPLEMHLRLATERHESWGAGLLTHPPAGISRAPPLAPLLGTIREVDRIWVPELRRWVGAGGARRSWGQRPTDTAVGRPSVCAEHAPAATTMVGAERPRRPICKRCAPQAY